MCSPEMTYFPAHTVLYSLTNKSVKNLPFLFGCKNHFFCTYYKWLENKPSKRFISGPQLGKQLHLYLNCFSSNISFRRLKNVQNPLHLIYYSLPTFVYSGILHSFTLKTYASIMYIAPLSNAKYICNLPTLHIPISILAPERRATALPLLP